MQHCSPAYDYFVHLFQSDSEGEEKGEEKKEETPEKKEEKKVEEKKVANVC